MPKNIGNDGWVINNGNSYLVSSNYVDLLQLRVKKNQINDFWSSNVDTGSIVNGKQGVNNLIELQNNSNYTKSLLNTSGDLAHNIDIILSKCSLNYNTKLITSLIDLPLFGENNFNFNNTNVINDSFLINSNFLIGKSNNLFDTANFKTNVKKNLISFKQSSLNNLKRNALIVDEKEILKLPDISNISNNGSINKSNVESEYMMYRQKRKTKDQKIEFSSNSVYSKFLNSGTMNLSELDFFKVSDLFRKNRKKTDSINLITSKRMLRTKRSLVLPAHVNITAITNSYDVVHSWFIPGLGLKFDCIPGRATHHTFYIDNVGFYYGQCAEICGRYHHHMPIRLCAIPFEHFVVWWNNFGLSKVNLRSNINKEYSFRKYNW